MIEVSDPLDLKRIFWPHVYFYDKQKEMIYSVRDSVETYVRAGNQLGKDFVAGYVAISFFLTPWVYLGEEHRARVERTRIKGPLGLEARHDPHTRRVLTTSVKDEHLDVLWGEIGRYVRTAVVPDGCPRLEDVIVMTHHEIRFRWETEAKNPLNYLKGQVSKLGEGLAGHHAAYTLAIGDEASGLADESYKQFQGWAKRMFFFGNPNPCQNFFRKEMAKGDLRAIA